MVGKQIDKHCDNCNETFTFTVSTGFRIDGIVYFTTASCPTCKTDLCKSDKEVIRKAKENDESIAIIMY